MYLWLVFLALSAAILFSGIGLSKYGDIISEKTGLGATWIGVTLIASVTSIPELATGLSSVTIAGAPDIAVGDVLGSCVFNLLILAFLDAIHRPLPLSSKAHHGHVVSAGFGLLLIAVILAGLFSGNTFDLLKWVGWYTPVIIAIYLIGIRLVFSYEKRQAAVLSKDKAVTFKYRDISLKQAVTGYSFNALVVIGAAIFLPVVAKQIAIATSLGETFVGNALVAISTSLPEVVVAFFSVKIGAIDLAIGNLFGSNMINILWLAVDDIFYRKGPILSFVDPSQAVSALSVIVMTAIAIIGLTYRAEKKRFFLAWDSIAIVGVYAINLWILFTAIRT